MKDKRLPRTGLISADNSQITFYLNDYIATFMNANAVKHTFAKEDIFIYGQTYDYHDIAIYKQGVEVPIITSRSLNTHAYIIAEYNAAKVDMSGFDRIDFTGGTLNQIFHCNSLVQNEPISENSFYHLQDDSIAFDVEINNIKCKLKVYSDVIPEPSNNGIVISNDKVVLSLQFLQKQPLDSVFKHIAKFKELISFMTFRKNVGFESITLYHNDQEFSPLQVYIKESQQFTKKDIMHNITFQDIKDGIPNLIKMLYSSKENKPSYELGFIPSDDKEISYMTNNRVRLICSSLECELSLDKNIETEENENLKELIEKVKNIIADHKNSPKKLSSKTYDNIRGSINYWSMSASDRICLLYHKYENDMPYLTVAQTHMCDKDISELVTYRNKITHGTWRVLNNSIAATAHELQGLVYCSILTRAGVCREKTQQLYRHRKILT